MPLRSARELAGDPRLDSVKSEKVLGGFEFPRAGVSPSVDRSVSLPRGETRSPVKFRVSAPVPRPRPPFDVNSGAECSHQGSIPVWSASAAEKRD